MLLKGKIKSLEHLFAYAKEKENDKREELEKLLKYVKATHYQYFYLESRPSQERNNEELPRRKKDNFQKLSKHFSLSEEFLKDVASITCDYDFEVLEEKKVEIYLTKLSSFLESREKESKMKLPKFKDLESKKLAKDFFLVKKGMKAQKNS